MLTTRTALAAAAAALVLAGCGGDPEPRIADPSPSPTTEPNNAEAPTPPDLPSSAMEEDRDGARAFVQHYWDVANYAQSTGDLSDLKDLSADSCGGCQGAISFVDDVYSNGGTIDGGAYTVSNLQMTELQAGETQLFDCDFKTRNTRQVIERPDKKQRVYPASTVDVEFTISFGPNGWQVDRWDVP